MLKIYHNPRCRKSRETLQLVEASGQDHEIVLYLQDTPSANELKQVVQKLNVPVESIIRKNEKLFKERYKSREIAEQEWYDILSSNPVLIERPIVTSGDKAILGRPPENVNKLL